MPVAPRKASPVRPGKPAPAKPATTDYAAIAARHIRKPGDRQPRFLIYGRNKKGKTTLAASGPRTLVIDPEFGAEDLPQDRDIWPVTQWGDMDLVTKAISSGQLKNADGEPYEWLAVDGLTRISNMALRFVMGAQEERDLDRIPGMVQQRDYGKAGELMKGMLFNLHSLPIGIVYTAQDRTETDNFSDSEDEDVEDAAARFVPDLPKGVRSSVNAIVDVIGRIYTVKVEAGTSPSGKDIPAHVQRRLWIGPSDAYDTGYRSEHKLPDFVKNPTVPKLVSLIKTGKV